MMKTENLPTLKIHKLSQEQYDREFEAGRTEENAFYLTPEEKLTAADVGAAPAIESTEYPGWYYRTVDGNTEGINPPMMPDVEYRTTKRYNGKPVYAKLILKRFPPPGISAGEEVVEYEIPHDIQSMEDGWMYEANAGSYPLPISDAYGKTYYTFDRNNIVLKLYNHSWDVNYWFSFWCEYTKTTD